MNSDYKFVSAKPGDDAHSPFGEIGDPIDVRTYRRLLPEEGRRETAAERNARVVNYNVGLGIGYQSMDELEQEAKLLYQRFNDLLVWGSGRVAWVGGTKATDKTPESTMNCSSGIVDRMSFFSEALHLLCLGCGVGFRILPEDVAKLPKVKNDLEVAFRPYKKEDWVKGSQEYTKTTILMDGGVLVKVGDSREGWITALDILLRSSILSDSTRYLIYDFSAVRPENTRIEGFGGLASGPEPLQAMIKEVNRIINEEVESNTLRPINVLDILCCIGDLVRSGNVRRSSLIALIHYLDEECLNAKRGIWTDSNLKHKRYRSMSNNSILYDGHRPSKEELDDLINKKIRYEGEPGFVRADKLKENRLEAALKYRPDEDPSYYVDNAGIVNPCGEISLNGGDGGGGFCNLSSTPLPLFVVDGELDKVSLEECLRLITRFAIRQTLVKISLPAWNEIQEKERLIGVNVCGWWEAFDALDIHVNSQAANEIRAFCKKIVHDECDSYSAHLGISRPLLATTGKPDGCLALEHTRTLKEGVLCIDELSSNYLDVGVSATDTIFKEPTTENSINSMYNNGLARVVRVRLKNGREITCTPNHPLYVVGKGEIQAQNLKEGQVLETYEGKYPLYWTSGSRQDLEIKQGKDVGTTELTEDISWLLGLYYSEGINIIQEDFRIQSNSKDVLKKAQRILRDSLGCKSRIKPVSNSKMHYLEGSSTNFSYLLEVNSLEKYPFLEHCRIPLAVRKTDYETLMSFISGYADGRGVFKNRTLTIPTVVGFARHLAEVLEALGLSISLTLTDDGFTCLLKVSNFYSNSRAIDIFNRHSVRALMNPVFVSATTNVGNPYAVAEVEFLEDLQYTYDIEVQNSHYYYQGLIKSHNTYAQLTTVASGCHPPYAPYYIRRVRISASDALASTLKEQGVPFYPEPAEWERYYRENSYKFHSWEYELDSMDIWDMLEAFCPEDLPGEIKTLVFEFPVKTKAKRATKDIPAVYQLENYKNQMIHYIDHNQSVTITVAENEWDDVVEWVYNNWDYIVGISFLPLCADNVYPLLPYMECTKEEYEERVSAFSSYPLKVDLEILKKYESLVEGDADDVDLSGLSGTCSTGACPLR